jgi:DNA polymerase-3 subunit epsilon
MELKSPRARAIGWAREHIDQGFVVISVQTTGLRDPEPIEIAVVDARQGLLMDTRVRPTKPIEPGATQVNGLTDADVANAPLFADVYTALAVILADQHLVNYGARFHREVIETACQRNGCPAIHAHWSDAMHVYACFYGAWNDHRQDFSSRSLANACVDLGIDPPGKSAVSKCYAIIGLIANLASVQR